MVEVTEDNVTFRCHRVLEPLHSMAYFAPETEAHLTAAGLRPGRMCYFAARAAGFGPVGPGPVAATFYNFNPVLVARHIPRAWTLASPADVVAARFAAVDAALRRLLGDDVVTSPEVTEAAELAREAAGGCEPEGRPLYAAHADLDWPTEPHLMLWHAVTLLREHRGDGHIAALVGYGLGGLAALVTHTSTGTGFLPEAARTTRGWSEDEWDAEVAALTGRGILDEDGELTEHGGTLRRRVEDITDASAAGPWRRLGLEKAARLHDIGRRLSRVVVANGAFPPGVFADRSNRSANPVS